MPRTLLLADDSITIQKVVAITFAAEDFTVVTVDNGEDALAKARELRPAVILADVVMPKRNGYDVAQAIKSDPQLGSTPVLLLAGTFEPFDAAKAAASRADGHIMKPFDSQALIDKVNELLGGAPAARPAGPAWSGAAAAPAAAAPAPVAARAPAPSVASGMPQRPQPISTSLPRPAAAPVAAPRPVAAPAPVAAPPAPVAAPAPAPFPLRPAAAAPSAPSTRPAPVPQTQPMAPPAPLPLAQPSAAPAPIPLGNPPGNPSPLGWGAAATPRPPAPVPPAARVPAAPPSVAAKPLPLTPAWGIPAATPPAATSPAAAPRRDPFGLGQPAPLTPKPAVAQMAEAAAAASMQASPADIQLDVPLDEPGDTTDVHSGFDLGGSDDLLGGPSAAGFNSGSLADLAQQDSGAVIGSIELTEEVEEEKLELASPHEFLGGPPTPAARPSPAAPTPFRAPAPAPKPAPLPLAAVAPAAPPPAAPPAAASNSDGEAALRLALSQASKEVIERVVWEVVPQLAETIVREHVERLAQQRSGK